MPPPNLDTSCWTYGCEHELADWDCNGELPTGFSRTHDHTIVNSNGIAASPNPKHYPIGGEIITPPSNTPKLQVNYTKRILD